MSARVGRDVDIDRLIARLAALRGFVEAVERHVPQEAIRPARDVVQRAGQRLELSRAHTVVALAGATGSGKSSLFNTVAGAPASAVGVRRPVTGATHAYVAGTDPANALLEWLDVPPARRFVPASTTDDGWEGLVLLDLPDVDSIRSAHRDEVDRVLDLADLVVWVTDPQKYADAVLHQRYLRTYAHRAATTVVVLNHIDRLSGADASAAAADLRTLLRADGLPSVQVLTTSATTTGGTAALDAALRDVVAKQVAMLQRLSSDVDDAVATCEDLVSSAAQTHPPARQARRELVDALATAAGITAIADATSSAYRRRARASTGWPPTRWLQRLRRDPLVRLRLGGPRRQRLAEASARPSAPSAAHAAVDLATRALCDRYAGGLPSPWPAAALAAARSRRADLTDRLDQAAVTTDFGLDQARRWWRAFGLAQWLATLLAISGALWLLGRVLLAALGFNALDYPHSHWTGVMFRIRRPHSSAACSRARCSSRSPAPPSGWEPDAPVRG
jgi:GTPase Era involved in 16S rRNA processing